MTSQVQQAPILPSVKCHLKVYILLSSEFFSHDHEILTCGGTSVPCCSLACRSGYSLKVSITRQPYIGSSHHLRPMIGLCEKNWRQMALYFTVMDLDCCGSEFGDKLGPAFQGNP